MLLLHISSQLISTLGEQMAVPPSGRSLQTMPGEDRLSIPFNVIIQGL